MSETGKIKTFDEVKRCGWIKPDRKRCNDMFFHVNALVGNCNCGIGTSVSYDVDYMNGRDGKPCASNVESSADDGSFCSYQCYSRSESASSSLTASPQTRSVRNKRSLWADLHMRIESLNIQVSSAVQAARKVLMAEVEVLNGMQKELEKELMEELKKELMEELKKELMEELKKELREELREELKVKREIMQSLGCAKLFEKLDVQSRKIGTQESMIDRLIED
jgi:cold shock CspA family protein